MILETLVFREPDQTRIVPIHHTEPFESENDLFEFLEHFQPDEAYAMDNGTAVRFEFAWE